MDGSAASTATAACSLGASVPFPCDLSLCVLLRERETYVVCSDVAAGPLITTQPKKGPKISHAYHIMNIDRTSNDWERSRRQCGNDRAHSYESWSKRYRDVFVLFVFVLVLAVVRNNNDNKNNKNNNKRYTSTAMSLSRGWGERAVEALEPIPDGGTRR